MNQTIETESTNRPWINASSILQQETLKMLENSVTRETCNLVDGWAAASPTTVKAWEEDGSLFGIAKSAENQALQAQQRATGDGVTHLSAWERNEIYGGPNASLPF